MPHWQPSYRRFPFGLLCCDPSLSPALRRRLDGHGFSVVSGVAQRSRPPRVLSREPTYVLATERGPDSAADSTAISRVGGGVGLVGAGVGLGVGLDVVGLGVGLDVGLRVGLRVGINVGSCVGSSVGVGVGSGVGSSVGSFVGPGDGSDLYFF